MGVLRKALPYAFPMGRVGMALWAWRHRHDIAGWAGFAGRSLTRVTGEQRADVLVEARLRARLTGDARTRGVDGLQVEVDEGVATLRGLVEPDAHDACVAIATNTSGVTRVRDEMQEPKPRRSHR